MTLTEEIQRVLALSKLATGCVQIVQLAGDHNVDFIHAATKLIRTHGPTIAALAERLEAAEERVRVLDDLVSRLYDDMQAINRDDDGGEYMNVSCDAMDEIEAARAAIDTARAGEER